MTFDDWFDTRQKGEGFHCECYEDAKAGWNAAIKVAADEAEWHPVQSTSLSGTRICLAVRDAILHFLGEEK